MEHVDLFQVLIARAEARALLFRCGEYEDSGEAVAPLLDWAHEMRLVEDYGAQTIWAIVNDAFRDETASTE